MKTRNLTIGLVAAVLLALAVAPTASAGPIDNAFSGIGHWEEHWSISQCNDGPVDPTDVGDAYCRVASIRDVFYDHFLYPFDHAIECLEDGRVCQ